LREIALAGIIYINLLLTLALTLYKHIHNIHVYVYKAISI